MISSAQRLAVLGSPISHSRSPAVHAAAYRVLDLNWEYSAVEVASGGLRIFFEALDSEWRGLSLTMPLKREVLPLLDELDDESKFVGAANTVLFDGGVVRGFNTDVLGAQRMLSDAVPGGITRAVILGGGATACSLVVALSKLGTRELIVSTRSPEQCSEIVRIADELGLVLSVGDLSVDVGSPDVLVSTLPGNVPLAREFPLEFRHSVPLVDVAYDPWPTPLAQHWSEARGTVAHSGLAMLVYQALEQVRIFVGGDRGVSIPHEAQVLEAMKRAASSPA